MENYQKKFKNIIYIYCYEIYKKCYKIILNKNKKIEIKFNNINYLNLLNSNFIIKLSNQITQEIPTYNSKLIYPIIKNYFLNKKFPNKIILDVSSKQILLENLYKYFNFNILEAQIFSICNQNNFKFYLIKNKEILIQIYGLLIILCFIFWLK